MLRGTKGVLEVRCDECGETLGTIKKVTEATVWRKEHDIETWENILCEKCKKALKSK